jgi:hypothetical protein
VVRPEQEAVVWATTAASLTSAETERATALLQLGQAVAFQFFCRMPGGFLNYSPWTPLSLPPAPPVEPQVEVDAEAAAAPLQLAEGSEAQQPETPAVNSDGTQSTPPAVKSVKRPRPITCCCK